ncbi:hypothetical protein CPB84DRAFT_1673410 [Gymnopilus junonius]|uniref:DUF1772-domain-containing protein n=1 Tax=Gymnopilus junonius TaxID=109634 RepID=A0A9P5TSY7_GYMJU|nr:hypothetical protein CPB84DRAFT_1673410 [Gymnopilus junonius]
MLLKGAKIAALLGSGVLAGGNFYISAFAIPALLSPYKAANDAQQNKAVLPAKTLQTQWKYVYNTGKLFFPFLALKTSIVYLFLAAHDSPDSSKLYALAAVSTISIVPYTFALMMGNIKKIEAEVKEDDPEDVTRLRKEIVKWNRFNFGRAALIFTGFALGTWAVVDSL